MSIFEFYTKLVDQKQKKLNDPPYANNCLYDIIIYYHICSIIYNLLIL
jgi:hypothetical protein